MPTDLKVENNNEISNEIQNKSTANDSVTLDSLYSLALICIEQGNKNDLFELIHSCIPVRNEIYRIYFY